MNKALGNYKQLGSGRRKVMLLNFPNIEHMICGTQTVWITRRVVYVEYTDGSVEKRSLKKGQRLDSFKGLFGIVGFVQGARLQ